MSFIRRDLLLLAGVALSGSAIARIAKAQGPAAGPKLTQILRQDLAGQDQQVQESVVSTVEFPPGAAAPWHMHPGAQEILYTLEGNLIVEVEGREPITVKAGQCSIIPADIPHLARNDSTAAGAKALVVHSRSAKEKPLVVPEKKTT
jgi:quercetin dioxygenase-like cupin family protein